MTEINFDFLIQECKPPEDFTSIIDKTACYLILSQNNVKTINEHKVLQLITTFEKAVTIKHDIKHEETVQHVSKVLDLIYPKADITYSLEWNHMKARIYLLFGMENEAIKVLKKWKRFDSNVKENCEKDIFASFLIGFLYKKENNSKEALKWLKKVHIESSLDSSKNGEVLCMSLFEIAEVKFQQKEYQTVRYLLNELQFICFPRCFISCLHRVTRIKFF